MHINRSWKKIIVRPVNVLIQLPTIIVSDIIKYPWDPAELQQERVLYVQGTWGIEYIQYVLPAGNIKTSILVPPVQK